MSLEVSNELAEMDIHEERHSLYGWAGWAVQRDSLEKWVGTSVDSDPTGLDAGRTLRATWLQGEVMALRYRRFAIWSLICWSAAMFMESLHH